jgi:5-hydroxyisourate hydrolase-like protein (transthyretin family)
MDFTQAKASEAHAHSSLPNLRWRALGGVLLCGLLTAPFLQAQTRLEGRLMNGTTGQPVAHHTVQLLAPRGGMQQVASASTDAEGRFTFALTKSDSNAFYLLQAVFQGVNYHLSVQAESEAAQQADLTVYEPTSTPPRVRIQSARIIIHAEGERARVQELFALQNLAQPPRTYVNPDGTFRFRLGSAAGDPSAAVAGQMNIPIPQSVQDGKSPGEFYINYPLKPGLTGIMVAYDADYRSQQFALRDQVEYPIDQLELQVFPSTLAVESRRFESLGVDTVNGIRKFAAQNLPSQAVLEARVSGEAAPSSDSAGEASGGGVRTVPTSLTRLGVPLLVCFLLVLLWALGVRTAREYVAWKERGPASATHKQLESKLEALLNALADLDELHAAGKVVEKSYWKERLELKAKVVAILKKNPALLEPYAARHVPR